MRRSKINTQQIVEDFKVIHGDYYDYSLVEYKTMHTKVKIICPIHGVFEQSPHAHIRQKQGCKKCSLNESRVLQKDNTNSFINKAKSVHGNRYDYSLVEYGNNAHDKVQIICREHGVFLMSPNSHLSKAANCPVCARRHTGWTKTSWKNSCEGKIAKLYFIRCFNENEEFYKIGITNKSTIGKRFYHKSLMPYNFEVINVIESEDAIHIYNLERALHLLHKKFKYKPSISFAGDTECFNRLLIKGE